MAGSELPAEVRLSQRERDVLTLVVYGETSAGIALKLGVSVKRVRNIKWNLRVKLARAGEDTPCLVTAMARASQMGLVDAFDGVSQLTRCNA